MELSPSEYQPCPLQFYDFKQLDHRKNCTIYSSVCIRQDQVSLDELPTLEAELLLLKENIQNHINLLTSEIAVLNDWQVKRKRKHSDTGESLSSVTRSKPVPPSNDGNVPNSKKFKSNQSSGDDQPGGGRKKKSGKSKGSSDFVADKGPIESALIKSKTEGADKFWSLLEPYFADITEADLTSLSENTQISPSVFEVPTLGSHYSHQWAIQDLHEEGKETAKLLNQSAKDTWQNESLSLLSEGVTANKNDQTAKYGPLTQKLMAMFLEESNNSQLNVHNKLSGLNMAVLSNTLEQRLKEELMAFGLLESHELSKDSSADDDDEIVKELVKTQNELKAVHEYNLQQKRMIQSMAKSEMKRQDIRKQLQETDSEITDWLKRFMSYRQRKKRESIKPKEKEIAQKCLEKRQRLIQHLLV